MNINGLKIRPAQLHATPITQMKSVAQFGLKLPEAMPRMITRLWADSYGPSMSTYIDKYAKEMYFESDNDYTWKVVGSAYRNIPVIEVRDSQGHRADDTTYYATEDTPFGANGELVQFVFDKAYFGDGTLILGQHNEYYPFRVMGEGYAEGSNWVVTARLMGNAFNGCPAGDLYAGMKFSRGWAPVEPELSRRVGNIVTSTSSEMRNGWTVIRKSHKFTGAADVQQKLCCELPVKVLKKDNTVEEVNVTSWFTYEEKTFFDEWVKECADAEMWARDNRTNNGYVDFGKSGNVIKVGNGFMAQMEAGRTIAYSGDFDIDDFVDSLNIIFTNGNIPISERNVIVVTGTWGMTMASRSINQTTHGFLHTGVNGINREFDLASMGLISKTTSEVNQYALKYAEGQFTEYYGPNGLHLTFVLDRSFDDPVRNKIMAPDGKGPLSSRAFRVIDMGNSTEPNIYRCRLKGPQYNDIIRYKLGMRNPWGIKSELISSDEDASSIHAMTTFGTCILDPTRCLNYIPAGLVA